LSKYGRKLRIIVEEKSIGESIPLTIFNQKKKWGRPKDEWKQLTIRLLNKGYLRPYELFALGFTYRKSIDLDMSKGLRIEVKPMEVNE